LTMCFQKLFNKRMHMWGKGQNVKNQNVKSQKEH
jgi:hypothetical protein